LSHPSSLNLPAQFFVPFAQLGQSEYLSSHAFVQMPHMEGQPFMTAAGLAAHSCSPPVTAAGEYESNFTQKGVWNKN
jgi:hypothetical protein